MPSPSPTAHSAQPQTRRSRSLLRARATAAPVGRARSRRTTYPRLNGAPAMRWFAMAGSPHSSRRRAGDVRPFAEAGFEAPEVVEVLVRPEEEDCAAERRLVVVTDGILYAGEQPVAALVVSDVR